MPDGDLQSPRLGNGPASHMLPRGMRVGEFEILGLLGEGGFSVVYRAWDHSLEREVALKEYLPASLAARGEKSEVFPRSERHRDTFELGLKSFVNEAKLLARFDHPSLVKVFRFWEANGTAYTVMPLYVGATVKDTVRAMAQPPDEAWLRGLLDHLTQALSVLHAEQVFHRDIAPDNVMLLAGGGQPVLLDFGAARRVIGDHTQTLTVILKPGYAPLEQYAEVPGMRQGPWTDVYALAAMVYWAAMGRTPPPSVGRIVNDHHVPLEACAGDRFSAHFVSAVDRGLAVRPEQRTQSIAEFRADMGLDGAAPTTQVVDSDATVIRPRAPSKPSTGPATTTRANAAPTLAAGPTTGPATAAVKGVAEQAPRSRLNDMPATPGTKRVAGTKRAVGVAAATAGLLLMAAAAWWWAGRDAPADGSVVVEDRPGVPSPTAEPAPQLTDPPQPQKQPVPLASAAASLDDLMRLQDPAVALRLQSAGLGFTFAAAEQGTLYVVAQRQGDDVLRVLASVADAQAAGGGADTSGGLVELAGLGLAPGRWRAVAVLSRRPRQLAVAGWHAEASQWLRRVDAATPLAGEVLGPPQCDPPGSTCDGGFGAAEWVFEVTLPVEVPVPTPAPADDRPLQAKTRNPPALTTRTERAAGAPNPECARIMSRLSLGETSPDLLARMKALNCQ